MTKMNKGFLAALLTLVLMIGTVASAATQDSRGTSREAAGAAIEVAGEKKAKPLTRGLTMTVTDFSHDVAPGDAQMSLQVGGVLKNKSDEAIDLAEVSVLLRDESGKVQVPARIDIGSDSRVLKPGEEVKVNLLFPTIPAEAMGTPLQLVMTTPHGEASLSITIEVGCSYPPLKCWIKVTINL